jgi:hypothetical protein
VSYAKCYLCLWIHCPFLIAPSDFTYVYIMITLQIQYTQKIHCHWHNWCRIKVYQFRDDYFIIYVAMTST